MNLNQKIDRVEKIYGLPEFFDKTAAEADTSSLSITAFADKDKQYPVYSKTACYLSNALFWDEAVQRDNQDDVSVGRELLKAASNWKILDDVRNNILNKVQTTKIARTAEDLDEDNFAYVDNEMNVRLFPLVDAESVEKSASEFYEMRASFPMDWRRVIGRRILEKASEFNALIDEDQADYIEKAAGKGVAPTDHLISVLNHRSNLLHYQGKIKLAEKTAALAQAIENKKTSREFSEKIANVIGMVDEEGLLYQHYTNSDTPLNMPEEDCHVILRKHAASEVDSYVRLANGNFYHINEIQNFLQPGHQTVFGKSASTKEIASSLNEKQANALSAILKHNGIIPIESKALELYHDKQQST